MKKLYFVFALAAAVVSCQKIETVSNGSDFEVFATVEDTRTANDGLATKWVSGDAFNVFHAAAGSTTYVSDGSFAISNATTGNATGKLSGTLDASASYDWYAFYPYTSQMTSPEGKAGYATFGSTYNGSQTQKGNDNMAHLAGSKIPLCGVAKAVSGSDSPSITFSPACSVVEINVTNSTDNPLTVSSVILKAPEAVVGTYFVNFAGSSISYTPSGASYVSNEAKLTVSGGTAVSKGSSAKFYLAVKPFTANSGSSITISVNGYEKTVTLSSQSKFSAGKIKKLNFNYDKASAAFSPNLTNAEIVAAFAACTVSGYGDMTIESASGQWTGTMNRGNTLSYVQLRDQSPARLISPVYPETIKSITVNTCNNSAKDRTFYVIPGNTVPSAYTEDGFASNIGHYKTLDANESFKIDFADATKQFEIVVLGGAVYIGSIDVELGAVAKKSTFIVDTTPIDVAADAVSASFGITADSDVDWTIANVSGLTITPSSGSGSATVNISFAANTSTTQNVEKEIVVSTTNTSVLVPTQTIQFLQRKVVSSTAKYVKVTSDSQISAGKYLIVFGNEAHATIVGSDLAKTMNVTITSNEIANSASLEDACVLFETATGGFTVKLPSGKYLSCNSNSNKCTEVVSPFVFTKISVANGISGLDSASNQRYLYENQTGPYFRFYKANNDYILPTLYKFTE